MLNAFNLHNAVQIVVRTPLFYENIWRSLGDQPMIGPAKYIGICLCRMWTCPVARAALAAALILPSAPAFGVTVPQDASYTLRASDDQETGLRACAAAAQQKAVAEEASLVESTSELDVRESGDRSVTSIGSSRVRSYVAAVVGSKILDHTYDSGVVTCHVEVTYDPTEVRTWALQRQRIETAPQRQQPVYFLPAPPPTATAPSFTPPPPVTIPAGLQPSANMTYKSFYHLVTTYDHVTGAVTKTWVPNQVYVGRQ